MDTINYKTTNESVFLTGKTFLIKEQIRKYGFSWNGKVWTGNNDQLEILKKYVLNFKSSKIKLIEVE